MKTRRSGARPGASLWVRRFALGKLAMLTDPLAAKRRVSFAPEATLHTWDVVEYLRDATTSSASSDATRRASTFSQGSAQASTATDSDVEEPPSTPPEQVEEQEPEPGSSPANQRDLHQKKHRRRSSGIPPMNFNNPDDLYSSSPMSGDNVSQGGSDAGSDSEENDEQQAKAQESPSEESSENSARLDAALRQASALAGTQRLDFDEDGDKTMDLAEDEITASFKPWAKKNAATSFQDQENVDPFYPVLPTETSDDDNAEDEEMSMDITRAMGRIVPQSRSQPQSLSPDVEDISMDLTMPLGSIQQASIAEQGGRRKSLKRRVSLLEPSHGSPAKRPAGRRASLRQRTQPEQPSSPDDATMDFTTAIGGITSKTATSKQDTTRRKSVETSFGDETMDFTVAMGSIKDSRTAKTEPRSSDLEEEEDEDEDMSMEFTNVIGGIKNFNRQAWTPEKPTPVLDDTPTKVKTPTPNQSAKKSHDLLAGLPDLKPTRPIPSPKKSSDGTPRRSPGRPKKNLEPSTPDVAPQQRIEDFEPSPFVHSAPQSASKAEEAISTPKDGNEQAEVLQATEDPIAAPLLNRRRSSLSAVQFSPLAATRDEPTLKSAAILASNIKLLSTPRKQALMSPVKRGMTPKKAQTPQKASTPKQKSPTPKKATPRRSLSPRKRVVFGQEPSQEESVENQPSEEAGEEVERISLQDFLDMTKIRFMDLSTTKRRHTAAPTAFYDKDVDEKEESLDRYIVAAACTLPEFELYQHACHEMKKYISDGRHFVRTMEANVMEDNPMLFSEYLTAPPDQRVVMDNQFKNLKTNARLEARGEWYSWRSTLLRDLKAGLLGTMDGLRRDENTLTGQEALLDAVLPPLVEQHGHLESECTQLQQRHDELNSCDREELEQAREQLVATDAELAEKRKLLAQLQQELADTDARIQAAKERKVECIEEIKAAERVREECRGWTTTEVNDLKGKHSSCPFTHLTTLTSPSQGHRPGTRPRLEHNLCLRVHDNHDLPQRPRALLPALRLLDRVLHPQRPHLPHLHRRHRHPAPPRTHHRKALLPPASPRALTLHPAINNHHPLPPLPRQKRLGHRPRRRRRRPLPLPHAHHNRIHPLGRAHERRLRHAPADAPNENPCHIRDRRQCRRRGARDAGRAQGGAGVRGEVQGQEYVRFPGEFLRGGGEGGGRDGGLGGWGGGSGGEVEGDGEEGGEGLMAGR
jgi:kinetochore protein Spc7/SPC105